MISQTSITQPNASTASLGSVVIIDDEQDILDVLRFNLEAQGVQVEAACTGRAGLDLIFKTRPQLVILDLMLPDISGTEVCRTLRTSAHGKKLPILMLSACNSEIDKVVGFEVGVDDYVTKPFSLRELLLRVEALHRRSVGNQKTQRKYDIEFGYLRVDLEAHRVWVKDEEVCLTSIELKLLATLYGRKNRVQTRFSLLEEVWGMHEHISTRTVDAHVKRLREKLGCGREYIETVRGVGYRFRESPTRIASDYAK